LVYEVNEFIAKRHRIFQVTIILASNEHLKGSSRIKNSCKTFSFTDYFLKEGSNLLKLTVLLIARVKNQFNLNGFGRTGISNFN